MTTRTFVYIGGKEFDGTDLPGVVKIYETEFRMDAPVTLDSDTFPGGRAKFDYAVSKLGTHPHFQSHNPSGFKAKPAPAPVDTDKN